MGGPIKCKAAPGGAPPSPAARSWPRSLCMVAKSLVVVVGCGEPSEMHRVAAHEKRQPSDGSRRDELLGSHLVRNGQLQSSRKEAKKGAAELERRGS